MLEGFIKNTSEFLFGLSKDKRRILPGFLTVCCKLRNPIKTLVVEEHEDCRFGQNGKDTT